MILALSYFLTMIFTQLGLVSFEIGSIHQIHSAKQTEVLRTMSETNYILSDYGVWIEPRKLGRKERFALALTNLADSGQ
jgi:hypothetical protein